MEEKGLESIEPDNLYQMRINLHPFFYLSTLSSKKTNVSLMFIFSYVSNFPLLCDTDMLLNMLMKA